MEQLLSVRRYIITAYSLYKSYSSKEKCICDGDF